MQGIHTVAVLFVATLAVLIVDQTGVQAKAPKKCPKIDPKNTTIHIAHEYDCTKFYMCLMGQKIERDCPIMNKKTGARLYFNPELQVCDWPWNVTCTSDTPDTTTKHTTKHTPPTDETPTPIPNITITPSTSSTDDDNIVTITLTPSGATSKPTRPTSKPESKCPKDTDGNTIKIRHETKCNYYYLCTNGVKILQRCPSGKFFNPKIKKCDKAENVDCDDDSMQHPIIPKKCPKNDFYKAVSLPHECRCDKYYKCQDSNMILQTCPNGYEYDYFRKVCDRQSVVNCIRPIPELDAADTPATAGNDKCPSNEEGKMYEHENSCNYYQCVKQQKVVKQCNSGLHFNVIKQMCEYRKGKCEVVSRTTRGPTTTASDVGKNGCPKDHSKTVKLPDEKNCNIYYLCEQGKKSMRRCRGGHVFNPKLQVCDLPENVPECESFAESSSSEFLNTCPPAGSTEKRNLPYECDCTKYYVCRNGYQVLHECPTGLHYDYESAKCISQEIADCRPTSGTTTSRPISTSCVGKPEGTKFPNTHDCSTYYKCQKGHKILQQCPKNLHYNPVIGNCDLPENARCEMKTTTPRGDRQPKCPATGSAKIPDVTDCRYYYKCYNGNKQRVKCYSDFHYNPKIKNCDLPENYPCEHGYVVEMRA